MVLHPNAEILLTADSPECKNKKKTEINKTFLDVTAK